jgi:hypothetical protein
MAQAVIHLRFVADVRVRASLSPCGFYGGHSVTGTGFLRVFRFSLSISFRRGSPYSYITRGINNRAVGGSSSETYFRPIDMGMLHF